MNVADAVRKLTTNPKQFLKDNYLIIAGGSTRLPGPTIFQMKRGTAKVKTKQLFWYTKRTPWDVSISNTNGGNPGPGVTLGSDEFVAYYIPMTQQATPAFGQPPTNGTLDLLITSQLTGCTFAFSTTGQVLAAHLQPVRGVAQATNRTNMATIMTANMGAPRLVQKGVDYDESGTIVGKWNGTNWKYYLQSLKWNPGDGENGFREVTGIVRL